MTEKQKERLDIFYEIIKEKNSDRTEDARDFVQKEDVPYLIKHYKNLSVWYEKRNLIDIIQDEYVEGMDEIMLDFLRAPYSEATDMTELTKAVALGFLGEEYDKFMKYYNDRDLLRSDVLKVLADNNLHLDEKIYRKPEEEDNATPFYEENKSPLQNLADGACSGELSQVYEAVQHGANVNGRIGNGNLEGMSMLILALSSKHYDVAEFLIENGADVNYKRQSKSRPDPEKGQTPMWWAATNGSTELIELLLQKGADINISDSHGSTPLCTAASSGKHTTVKLLLENGADIHAMIYDNRKAINLAANIGCSESVKLLIEAGNNPDYCGSSGYTPLMLAAENGNQELIKVLLEKKADVNAKHSGPSNYTAYKGMPPLAFAVSGGFVRASKLLIDAGADVNYIVPQRVNYKNDVYPAQRIIELAKGKRAQSVRDLLIKNGAAE